MGREGPYRTALGASRSRRERPARTRPGRAGRASRLTLARFMWLKLFDLWFSRVLGWAPGRHRSWPRNRCRQERVSDDFGVDAQSVRNRRARKV